MNAPRADLRSLPAGQPLASIAAVVRDLPVAGALFGPDLRCVGITRHLATMIGWPDSADGGALADGLMRQFVARLEPRLSRALDGETADRISMAGEVLAPALSGRTFHLFLRPLGDEDAPSGVLAWFTEITREKQGEAALPPRPGYQSTLAHIPSFAGMLERLLNGVPYPILVKDRSHRWLLVNDAMCALIGRPREELLGRTDRDVLPEAEAESFCAAGDQVFATGEAREAEERLTAADGRTHLFRTRRCLITIPGLRGGEPVLIAFITDITRKRQAEQALRQSEEHYRYAVELSPHSLLIATES
jgi:PAS domain S-box-containing protein